MIGEIKDFKTFKHNGVVLSAKIQLTQVPEQK